MHEYSSLEKEVGRIDYNIATDARMISIVAEPQVRQGLERI